MIEQNRKYSRKLTFPYVSLLLPICFVFFACAHQSTEYNMDQIDKVPMAIQSDLPEYPLSAKNREITARVLIRCLLDEEGFARNIEVVECDPEDARDVFGPPAVEAVKKWRFRPFEIRGKPVAKKVMLNLYFEPDPPSDEFTP